MAAKSTPITCDTKTKLVIATRLHLGKASKPPTEQKIRGWISNMESMASSATSLDEAVVPVIAVDATPKIDGYDFVQAIHRLLPPNSPVVILPVTPWGSFVMALNALVLLAKTGYHAKLIMFVSAEVNASSASIETLCRHVKPQNDEDADVGDDGVLVAGAVLQGHQYDAGNEMVPLNGRTCPWNTLAVWNVDKISLTGFLPVSDWEPTAGIEECVAIAVHQKLFPNTKAKLVALEGVAWEVNFEDDHERQKWHEAKMNSKLSRSETQLRLLNMVPLHFTGTVVHGPS